MKENHVIKINFRILDIPFQIWTSVEFCYFGFLASFQM